MVKLSEAVVQRCSFKKVFLEISQNSQENTCVRVSSLIKLKALGLQLYLKRDSETGVFLQILQISKNALSYRTTPVAASELCQGIFMNAFQSLFLTENF